MWTEIFAKFIFAMEGLETDFAEFNFANCLDFPYVFWKTLRLFVENNFILAELNFAFLG